MQVKGTEGTGGDVPFHASQVAAAAVSVASNDIPHIHGGRCGDYFARNVP